jgi:phage terminase large subunit-like protein
MTDEIEVWRKLNAQLAALSKAKEEGQLFFYMPYLKQLEFHTMGAVKSERLLMAGNQLGKTYSGAAEAAFHLTGLYPDWWTGRRWSRNVRMWIGGESSNVVRDTTQKLLLGDLAADRNNLGTGLIPKSCLPDQPNWSRGVDSGVDNISVLHKCGKRSTLLFKSYEQGRTKWQGDTIDLVWFDEEPPSDIYSEGTTRLVATDGMAYMTFTPLKGMSTVVKRFLNEPGKDRGVVRMRMADAPHMTPEMQEKALARYPEHERKTRADGEIMAGEGRVFNVAESLISVPPFEIPGYWKHLIGLDLGHGGGETAHPTAAVWLAHDPDSDILYVYGSYRRKGGSIPEHANVLRQRGIAPIAWPHDALAADKFSGKTIASHYKAQGLLMLSDHAQWPDGSNSVWAGIAELQNRMEGGRFKVFSNCFDWMEEYRSYHMEVDDRGKTKIVAIDDDLLSATRYGVMMLRYARQIDTSGVFRLRRNRPTQVQGLDFNPLG